MYKVFGDAIVVSRGDYALIPIRAYGVEDGEEMTFSITRVLDPDKPLIQKKALVQGGIGYISLASSETAALPTGSYLWDVVFRDFWGEGKPHTPQMSKEFRLVGVSHDV